MGRHILDYPGHNFCNRFTDVGSSALSGCFSKPNDFLISLTSCNLSCSHLKEVLSRTPLSELNIKLDSHQSLDPNENRRHGQSQIA